MLLVSSGRGILRGDEQGAPAELDTARQGEVAAVASGAVGGRGCRFRGTGLPRGPSQKGHTSLSRGLSYCCYSSGPGHRGAMNFKVMKSPLGSDE